LSSKEGGGGGARGARRELRLRGTGGEVGDDDDEGAEEVKARARPSGVSAADLSRRAVPGAQLAVKS
jgi:hypothetical protein